MSRQPDEYIESILTTQFVVIVFGQGKDLLFKSALAIQGSTFKCPLPMNMQIPYI